jgi:invasion protein IalB
VNTSARKTIRVTAAFMLAAASLPVAGQSATERTFETWVLRCETSSKGAASRCRMTQFVSHKESGQRILSLVIARGSGDQPAIATAFAPLGVYLPAGLTLQIDDGAPMKLEYEHCARSGCLVRMRLTQELLAQLKAGKIANYRFQDPNRKDITIPAPLAGFASAFEELK